MPSSVVWKKADDIKKRSKSIIRSLQLDWVKTSQLHFFRSKNSKTRSYARIWGLSRIWQLALKQKPVYIIEVISEKFDKLSPKKQDEVIIHELTHIPQTFSGSLTPHFKYRKRNFNLKVRERIKKYHKVK